MSVVDQLATYTNGLKLKTATAVQLKELSSVEEAMRAAEFYDKTCWEAHKAENKSETSRRPFHKRGNKPSGERATQSEKPALEDVTCHKCREKGHFANNCPNQKQRDSKNK